VLRKRATDSAYIALGCILAHFGLGPASMVLYLLDGTSTIIAGSVALAVLHPDLFELNDIDFYTSDDDENLPLLRFFQCCGYEVVPVSDFDDMEGGYFSPSVTSIVKFRRNVGNISTYINVMFVGLDSPIRAVVESHSTVVMNYVAWYGVVSLYPCFTLFRGGLAIGDSDSALDAIRKYVARGIEFANASDHPIHCSAERSIHNNLVLFLPFSRDYASLDSFEDEFTWSISKGPVQNSSESDCKHYSFQHPSTLY